MLSDYLPKDQTYRLAFILAITLHVTLAIVLLVKFNHAQQFVLEQPDIIHAFAVNDFTPTAIPEPPRQEIAQELPKPVQPVIESKPKPETQTPKVKNDDTSAILQKHMQQEQVREAAELKKLKKQLFKKMSQQTLQKVIDREKSMLPRAHLNSKMQGEVDKYKALILQAIANEWIIPEEINEGAYSKFLVSVGPKGVILDVRLIGSSGNALLDRSAKTAVLKASPLPVPDGILFDDFREIRLTVRPEGIS